MSVRSPSVASSCSSATSPTVLPKGSNTTATAAASPQQSTPAAPSMLQMLEYMRAFTTAQRQSVRVSPSPSSASSSKQGSPTEASASAAAWSSPPPPPPMLNGKGHSNCEKDKKRSEDATAKGTKSAAPRPKVAKRPRADSARMAVDSAPAVLVTPASTSEAQSGFGRHLRRFTIDSHARPEELLAALLQHTRSFPMAPPSTSSSSSSLSPLAHNAVAPSASSLSSFAEDESFWLGPPPSTASSSVDLEGQRAILHSNPPSSQPAPWSLDMEATQTRSNTSSVASSTTDTSQTAESDAIIAEEQDKIFTMTDHLQYPAAQTWLKQVHDITGSSASTFSGEVDNAAYKSLQIPTQSITLNSIPALLRSMLQQPPTPPSMQSMHSDNGMGENRFQADDAMASALRNNNQAAAATSMGMLDQFIANISASIDNQSSAAALAASALQGYPRHDFGPHIFLDTDDDYDHRPTSAVSSVSNEKSVAYDANANIKLTTRPIPVPRTKKALAKPCDEASASRAAPSHKKPAQSKVLPQQEADDDDDDKAITPARKKPRRAPRAKAENAAAPTMALSADMAVDAAELPPAVPPKKPERDQKRLADRRRRRRESHNAVERRRRDLINERIAELATLLPEPMLLEAIAHSTGGGTAPHIDLAPFTRKGIAEARARERAEAEAAAAAAGGSDDDSDAEGGAYGTMLAEDDEDASEAALLKAIAQSKPNKGIILTKSVDYIKQLHEVCAAMRARNIELQDQLESVRRAVFGGGGAAKEEREEQIDTNGAHSNGSLFSPKNALHRASDRFAPSFDTGSLRGPAFVPTLMMNLASNSISPPAT